MEATTCLMLTERVNERTNWISKLQKLDCMLTLMCLKDIILSRKSHLKRSSIGQFYSNSTLKMAEVQRWRTTLWLPGMRAGPGEGTGCEWERQRSYSSNGVLPCDCNSTQMQMTLYRTCICVEMAYDYAQLYYLVLPCTCGTQWKAQTSLTMLAPFCKALKRDIRVKNGS